MGWRRTTNKWQHVPIYISPTKSYLSDKTILKLVFSSYVLREDI